MATLVPEILNDTAVKNTGFRLDFWNLKIIIGHILFEQDCGGKLHKFFLPRKD